MAGTPFPTIGRAPSSEAQVLIDEGNAVLERIWAMDPTRYGDSAHVLQVDGAIGKLRLAMQQDDCPTTRLRLGMALIGAQNHYLELLKCLIAGGETYAGIVGRGMDHLGVRGICLVEPYLKEAAQVLDRQVIGGDVGQAVVHLRLGQLYALQLREDEAIAELRNAAEMDPQGETGIEAEDLLARRGVAIPFDASKLSHNDILKSAMAMLAITGETGSHSAEVRAIASRLTPERVMAILQHLGKAPPPPGQKGMPAFRAACFKYIQHVWQRIPRPLTTEESMRRSADCADMLEALMALEEPGAPAMKQMLTARDRYRGMLDGKADAMSQGGEAGGGCGRVVLIVALICLAMLILSQIQRAQSRVSSYAPSASNGQPQAPKAEVASGPAVAKPAAPAQQRGMVNDVIPGDASAPYPGDSLQEAEAVVASFYDSVNRKDYGTAYGMLSSEWQSEQSFSRFESGYTNTDAVACNIRERRMIADDAAEISVTLDAVENGQRARWSGTYQVVRSSDGWRIDRGRMHRL